MSIKEIADLITRKNYVFQVSIPGTDFMHGKTTPSVATVDSESIEAYLMRIANSNKATHLYIKLFTPNGSSYKPRGEHLIMLQQQPVATNATNVATTQQTLQGVAETAHELIKPQTKTGMTDKDYIDYKVLQLRYDELVKEKEANTVRVKKLETKVDDLYEENKKLMRENLTKDDKHSIELERKMLAIEKEGKEGLSGIFGELTKDPDTLKMLVGFIKPDHPMFQQQNEQKALEGATQTVTEIEYTTDKEANAVLNDIPRILSQKDGSVIGKVYLLFQEFLGKPEILDQAVKAYIPQYS